VQPLRKNVGGYHGEQIDISHVLRQIDETIAQKNWVRDQIALASSGGQRTVNFIAFRRTMSTARNRIYLSTGIHGDEPAGPLALLQLLREDSWPGDAALWLIPCLNPSGFPLNRRENGEGVDLNRDYRHLNTLEVKTHVQWLSTQPNFDISLCLHEDWEARGFYLYEQNPDKRASFADKIIEAVSVVCPIDPSEKIDGWTANDGIIRPNVNPLERPQWPESVYLISHKTRLGYTFEAPSELPLETRVAAHVAGVRAVLAAI
jgi:predicted deacylase